MVLRGSLPGCVRARLQPARPARDVLAEHGRPAQPVRPVAVLRGKRAAGADHGARPRRRRRYAGADHHARAALHVGRPGRSGFADAGWRRHQELSRLDAARLAWHVAKGRVTFTLMTPATPRVAADLESYFTR